MPQLKPYLGDFYLWHYVPSRIAGGIIAACFLVLTLWVIWRLVRTRTWFSIPFAIGGVSYSTDNLIPYAIQAVLILVAPALLAASIYMVLGRVIRSVKAEHHSIIRVTWLTRIFVLADVLSFIVQSGGASLQTNQDVNPDLAKAVVLVGLFAQVIAFGMFILAAILFHVRIRRRPTPASTHPRSAWRRTMVMLYFVNGLIMCRSIFRIVEYSMGTDSYLFNNEWPLYTFDGELMLLGMFCFTYWYPAPLDSTAFNDEASPSVSLHQMPGHHPFESTDSTVYKPVV